MIVAESTRGPSFGLEWNAETEVSAKKGRVKGKQSYLRSILFNSRPPSSALISFSVCRVNMMKYPTFKESGDCSVSGIFFKLSRSNSGCEYQQLLCGGWTLQSREVALFLPMKMALEHLMVLEHFMGTTKWLSSSGERVSSSNPREWELERYFYVEQSYERVGARLKWEWTWFL